MAERPTIYRVSHGRYKGKIEQGSPDGEWQLSISSHGRAPKLYRMDSLTSAKDEAKERFNIPIANWLRQLQCS